MSISESVDGAALSATRQKAGNCLAISGDRPGREGTAPAVTMSALRIVVSFSLRVEMLEHASANEHGVPKNIRARTDSSNANFFPFTMATAGIRSSLRE